MSAFMVGFCSSSLLVGSYVYSMDKHLLLDANSLHKRSVSSWEAALLGYQKSKTVLQKKELYLTCIDYAQETVSLPLSIHCRRYSQQELRTIFIEHMLEAVPYYLDTTDETFRRALAHEIRYLPEREIDDRLCKAVQSHKVSLIKKFSLLTFCMIVGGCIMRAHR